MAIIVYCGMRIETNGLRKGLLGIGKHDKENWSILQNELRETVGENNFSNWIAPLQFSKVEDGVAIFEVPTLFWEIMYPRIWGFVALSRE